MSEMTDQELIRRAHDLRKEASQLLYREGLFPLVAAVGPASIRGSFALDLMTWPDIDLSVLLPHEKDISTFFSLGKEIATQFHTVKMSFSNQFIRPDVPFDHGLYWGIRILYNDNQWKIDLWGYGEDAYRADSTAYEELSKKLQKADRISILRIKNEVRKRPEYRINISSIDIYEAIAQYNVKTVEEFDAWCSSRENLNV